MKNIKLLLVASLFLITVLYACKKKDKEEDVVDNGTMEIKKNGVEYTVKTFNNTFIQEVQEGYKGRRLDLRCNVDGGTFIVSVSNWDWQNPPTNGILVKAYDTDAAAISGKNTQCKEYPDATLCDAGLGSYFLSGGNNIYMTNGAADGTITVTANDATNRRISGSFKFTTFDFFYEDSIRFEGTFTNLTYKPLN